MLKLATTIILVTISFFLGCVFCFFYTYHHLPQLGTLAEWVGSAGTTGTVIVAWKNIYDREVPKLEISCMDLNRLKQLTITNKSNFSVTLTEIDLSSNNSNGSRLASTLPVDKLPAEIDDGKDRFYPTNNNNKIGNPTGVVLDASVSTYTLKVGCKYFDGSDKIQVRDTSGYRYVIKTKKLKKALKPDGLTDKKLILKKY